MSRTIGHISLLVRNYDEALAFFTQSLDFWRDYHTMTERGVRFVREPREEPYGTVAVFEDLYGNKWDLLQPRSSEADS
jgi:catechol 2,3-dioxygenase-like lactoylglutathione lyase family enzyme